MKLIDIHQVNVLGLGAEKFSDGIVQQVVSSENIKVRNIYLNKKSTANHFHKLATNILRVNYYLGIFSRLVEILSWRFFKNQDKEILVLGDLPLNTSAKQYVLCHQSLMFQKFPFFSNRFFKFTLFRILFKSFIKSEDVVLVQTKQMAENITKTFGPELKIRILDISSEHFSWPDFSRQERKVSDGSSKNLTLIYPAAPYKHKNHLLLNKISHINIAEVILTLNKKDFPTELETVRFIGRVSREHIYELYKEVDALLFLSSYESLGLPIFEAIKCNLPIICPREEYTRNLHSENCFLFDINNPNSLEEAISRVFDRLTLGWWPDWSFKKIINQDKNISIEEIILEETIKN